MTMKLIGSFVADWEAQSGFAREHDPNPVHSVDRASNVMLPERTLSGLWTLSRVMSLVPPDDVLCASGVNVSWHRPILDGDSIQVFLVDEAKLPTKKGAVSSRLRLIHCYSGTTQVMTVVVQQHFGS